MAGEQLDTYDEGGEDFPLDGERPYIGIWFTCCGVYQRVYRRPDVRVYNGRCPRCLRAVRLRVGPGGTSCRMFTAE